jgi:hypothetical protein
VRPAPVGHHLNEHRGTIDAMSPDSLILGSRALLIRIEDVSFIEIAYITEAYTPRLAITNAAHGHPPTAPQNKKERKKRKRSRKKQATLSDR